MIGRARLHHQMHRKARHVRQLPRTCAVVSAVGVSRRPALPQQIGHLAVSDGATREPARGWPELTVPPAGRQPHLDGDVRITLTAGGGDYAAEGRQVGDRLHLGGATRRGHERTRRHGLHGNDTCVRDGELGETFARRVLRRRLGRRALCQQEHGDEADQQPGRSSHEGCLKRRVGKSRPALGARV